MGKTLNDITIYTKDGDVRTKLNSYTNYCQIKSAEQKVELLGEDSVTIKTTSAAPIECSIGDYIIVYGSVYTLNNAVEVIKTGARKFESTLKFEGLQYKLMDAQFRNADASGHNPTASFSIVANLELLMQVLINNINRVAATLGEVWELGAVPQGTEYKDLSYSNQNCLAVLQSACQEFKTEFDIEETSPKHYKLNVRKQGAVFPLTFDYSKQSGVVKLTRKNVNNNSVVSRLYIEGGTQNISKKYRDGSERLRIDGNSYVEDEQAVKLFGVKESSKQYDDIYPKRRGKVTAIVEGSVLEFVDDEMFNLTDKDEKGNSKYLQAGTAAKVHFVGSCPLAGYEFEVASYDHKTHTFKLNKYEDKRGLKIPDGGSYSIQKGNEYVLLDIIMPKDPYITDAEAKLKAEGLKDLAKVCQPKVDYELEISSFSLERTQGVAGSIVNVFKVGDYLPVVDADINVNKNLRIKGFTRNAYNDPYAYKVTLGDSVDVTLIQKLIEDTQRHEDIITINNLTDVARARANWRSTQELLNMVFDGDGYFDTSNIKPNSIETMMLSVGNRASQFIMQDVQVICNPTINGKPAPNVLHFNSTGTAILTHYAIEEQERTWYLAAGNTTQTLTEGGAYYIYAQCAKDDSSFRIIASQAQIPTEQGSYYYFPIGVLSSIFDGYRELTLTYGSTRITGRTINCGRIESVDKSTYMDLDKGEIGGNIKFRSTDGTMKSVASVEQAASQSITAMQETINGIKEQVDGTIEYFYGSGAPSSETYPENEWSSYDDKKDHLNDMYTDTATGLEYRYSYSRQKGFYWQEVASSGIGTAIQRANEALGIANEKNHLYITADANTAPATGYQAGDTWLMLDTMQMRICVDDGAGNLSWQDVGYTDDTAANEALAELGDIASDSKLTPVEKLRVQGELKNIAGDYSALIAEASKVGVSYSALQTAVTALGKYLSPLLRSLKTTSTINRTEFDGKFKAYYDERTKLQLAISKGQVDSLEIGQGNYIANGANFENMDGWSFGGYATKAIYDDSTMGKVLRLSKTDSTINTFVHTSMFANGGNLMLDGGKFRTGRQYTIAFWAKASKAFDKLMIGFMTPSGSNVVLPYQNKKVGTEWQRITHTFVANEQTETDVRLFIRLDTEVYEYLMLTKFVLVEGTKAPEWTACADELKAEMLANAQTLKAITDNYTQIDGGLVLSTYLKLGALLNGKEWLESAGVKAMLKDKSEVAAYFGGTLAEAIAGKKGMTIIKHDGSLKADNAEITGKITATDGKFMGSLATKFNEIPTTGDTIYLSFETGFNWAGWSDSQYSRYRTLVLPTDLKYEGVQCCIVNSAPASGYSAGVWFDDFLIKAADGGQFMIANGNDGVTEAIVKGTGHINLLAVKISGAIKWVITNIADFQRISYKRERVTTKQGSANMGVVEFGTYTYNSATGYYPTYNTYGNWLFCERVSTGKVKFTFQTHLITDKYYIPIVMCKGHGYGWCTEKTKEGFVIQTADDSSNNDMDFYLLILEIYSPYY